MIEAGDWVAYTAHNGELGMVMETPPTKSHPLVVRLCDGSVIRRPVSSFIPMPKKS